MNGIRHIEIMQVWRILVAAIICVLVSAAACLAQGTPETRTVKVDFRRDVYPLLAARCFECHTGRDAVSGLRLDDRSEVLGETNGLPLVKIGDSRSSTLISRVTSDDKETMMPPKGKRLTVAEVDLLQKWIDQGLAWDESLLPPVLSKSDHWAFQPIKRPVIPKQAETANAIDLFVADGHRKHKLAFAPRASRRVLIRRLYLDLIGFPPTPGEVERYVNDSRPDAYGRLIERLLTSPQYGERWGRHWLDVARWSETEGYESNHPRKFAWRYRDYVVDAFNRDKPFDRFIREQIAGDELTPYSDENLIATGFLAATRLSSNEEDKWLQRNQMLVDVVNTTGSAFLGLTVACAQCHNHKFDPVSTRDYYRLLGYFFPGQPLPIALKSPSLRQQYEALEPAEYEQTLALKQTLFARARDSFVAEARKSLTPEMRAALDRPAHQRSIEQELLARKASLKLQVTPNGVEKRIAPGERKLYDALKERLKELQDRYEEPQTFAWYSRQTSPHGLKVLPQIGFYPLPFEPDKLAQRVPYLHVRGDVHNIGPKVTAGWPAIFDTVFERTSTDEQSATRNALADWLTDRRHPLVARVWVNRIWHYHFGQGIVATPSDFGKHGAPPSHPSLLDWLASELIDNGWITRHIHRLILMSKTYQQSSVVTDPRHLEVDSANRYLWHWRPRRLEAEAIRDSMLAVTGELDLTAGGPSVPPDDVNKSKRRSLYLYQKRGLPPDAQKLFDGPSEAAESCSRRQSSTSPLQSLYLLNSRFTQERARRLAEKILKAADDDRSEQIELAFLYTLNRQPDAAELTAAERFFERYQNAEEGKSSVNKPLEEFCIAILNLNEFVYIE